MTSRWPGQVGPGVATNLSMKDAYVSSLAKIAQVSSND